MNKEGKRCVLYIRVSTEMQVDGFSLDGQRNMLKRYAEREGMIIKEIYEDAGKSGKSIEGRPAFTKMINDIKNGLAIDYILVYKLSRFGRNAADILSSIELIQSYDINLIATEEGIDSSQTSGRLLISVLSAVSEIERENILEQTMNGRKEKARQGGWNGGFAPYGYQLINGELFINDEEAEMIKLIYDMYLSETFGCAAIAIKLNEQGLKKNVRQNGTSTRWSKRLVENILDNPIYAGKIAFGRRTKKKVKGTKNVYQTIRSNDYIISDGKHDAIIDEETWNRAQAKRLKGKRVQPHNNFERTFMLSNILKCPKCGSGMSIRYKRKALINGNVETINDYICKYYAKHDSTHEPCDYHGRMPDYIIEPYIIRLIKEMVATSEIANALKEKIGSQVDTSKFEKELANYKKNLQQLEFTKESLEHKIDYLPLDDQFREKKLKDYEKRLDDIYETIYNVECQIEELEIKIDGMKNRDITIDKIVVSLSKMIELFDDMNDEERRLMISKLIKSINFNMEGKLDNIVFKFALPGKEGALKEIHNNSENMLEYAYYIKDSDIKLLEEIEYFRNPNKTTQTGSSRVSNLRNCRRHIIREYVDEDGHNMVVFEENGEEIIARKYKRGYYIPKPKKDRKPYEPRERKEHYNRKQATYKQIQDFIYEKYNVKTHTSYIAEIKRLHGVEMQSNRRKAKPKNEVKHPNEAMKLMIEDALRHFGIIKIDQITD